MIRDRVTLGIIAGIIGNIFKEIFTLLLWKLNLKSSVQHTIAQGLFINPKSIKNSSGVILGFLTDFIIAMKLGILCVYYLSFTGKDNYLLKGMSLGHFAWFGMYGLIRNLCPTCLKPVSAKDSLSAFITHTVYGLVTAKVIVMYGSPILFRQKRT